MAHDAVTAIHTAIRAATSVSRRQCRTRRSHEGRDGGTVERGGRRGGEYVGDEGGATAPKEGRCGAGDAANAGGGGEEKGEDAGDSRATPPTYDSERQITEAPGCSEKRDSGLGS